MNLFYSTPSCYLKAVKEANGKIYFLKPLDFPIDLEHML